MSAETDSENDADGRADSAKLRAYQDGELDKRNIDVPEFVGKVSPRVERLMTRLHIAFREEGRSFQKTELYDRLLTLGGAQNAGRAVRQGDLPTIQNIVGEASEKHDISGVKTMRKLRDTVSRPAFVAYLHGQMGDGKTDFSLFLAELWKDEMESKGYRPELASNIETWQEAETVVTWDGFMEFLNDPEKNDRRLFIFDEASKHASGYSSDAQEARDLLGKTINLIRKYRGSIICIGHTGRDLHADIRRKCTITARKREKKKAVIRTRTDTGDGEGDLSDEMVLGGIPSTNFHYDHMEASEWEWGDQDDGDQMRVLKEGYGVPVKSEKELDLTEIFDCGESTIYRKIKD